MLFLPSIKNSGIPALSNFYFIATETYKYNFVFFNE